MDRICELGYCPYSQPYAAQGYELSCDNCRYYVAIEDWTNKETELQIPEPPKEET